MTNCTAEDETIGEGAGIFVAGADTATITDATIADNISEGYAGGGIAIREAELKMTRVSVTGNKVNDGFGGGGLYMYDTAASTLEDCTFDGNYSNYSGGGVMLYDTGNVDITGGSISLNEAYEGDGGGLYVYADSSAVITVKDVTIESNTITVTKKNGDPNAGVGVWVDHENTNNGKVNFTGATTIKNNFSTAENDGGGLYVGGGFVTLGPATVISGNTVGGSGGGIYAADGDTYLEGTISGNTASGKGGGIYSVDYVTLRDTAVVRNNTATEANGGNGIYSEYNNYVWCEPVNTTKARVCENPGATAQVTDNCAGGTLKDNCPASVCATGACPAA